ncbi:MULTISPECIES: tetratricopeptide repeat protein [unclassified Corallococcus]|uniref:tetratricopeptide repeat protein n=1 Tax=unclassified Corallococcus TaxID=2685029 RepID=UPI001A908E94|nr:MULTISPECIES: tetratricopeptide repeat protein [unclassified Corallococcus]MBN9686004.1 tetratricopeptide repeat protein [Corallococcus sp. NCSPR001]WAS82558.1 tetratricopeptide repeat protein [Corallococcus sp. NCRR]
MSSRLRALPLIALLASGACTETPKLDPKDQAEGLYLQANSEYLKGNFDAALKSFDEMKALTPGDPRLPAARGEVLLSMSRLEEAEKEFEAALRLDAKRSTNWSRLGFIQAQLGKKDEARQSLQKALALHPKDFNALEQLGELAEERGDHDEAVRDFTQAAEAAPDASKADLLVRAVDVLTKQGRQDEVLGLLRKVTGQGVRTPEVLTALGDAEVRAGRLPEAAAVYEEAAKKSPKDPTLWELVAEIQLKLNKREEALKAYGESLKVKDRAVVHVALAKAHLTANDRAAAEGELQKALETVSGADVGEMQELADLLSAMGRKQDALRILTSLGSEPGHAKNMELQLSTARLARDLKDTAAVQAACARVAAAAADGGVVKCP